MKKLLTILCLVLLSSYSYSQDLPPDGPYEDYYENGQLKEKGNLRDGKENGLWEFFYENGQLERRGNNKDGEMDGLWEFYQENGQLEFRSNYKDGKWDGFIEFFNEDGLFWFKNCYKNGEEINMSYCYERFYENLQFRSKGNVKNDKKEGLWEYFDEDGNLTGTEEYKDGVLQE